MVYQPEQSQAALFLAERPTLREQAAESPLFETLKRSPKRVQIDSESFYLVEGDLLLDEDELMVYALQQEGLRSIQALGITPGNLGLAIIAEQPPMAALIGITQAGKIVRWKEGLVLTYCVLRDTFLDQVRYEQVRANMQQATTDWERVCGIKFEYRSDLDGSRGTQNPGVLFTVRGIDAGGQFIASAFFPNDPPSRRRVLIDPSYFDPTLRFNKVGVLRHELGHVLGFRHEHIRSGAPAACPDEPLFGTTPLTAYDPQSVMHYFCGGVGSTDLALTNLDRIGSQKVYGPPLDAFLFIE